MESPKLIIFMSIEKIEKLETSITNIDGKEGEDLETKNVVKKFTKQ